MPNNRASGSKRLKYAAVNYELLAVSEAIKLQCFDIDLKYKYTLMKLGDIPFNTLNIMSEKIW